MFSVDELEKMKTDLVSAARTLETLEFLVGDFQELHKELDVDTYVRSTSTGIGMRSSVTIGPGDSKLTETRDFKEWFCGLLDDGFINKNHMEELVVVLLARLNKEVTIA